MINNKTTVILILIINSAIFCDAPTYCNTYQACLDSLSKYWTKSGGTNPIEVEIAKSIHKLGPNVIPKLFKLCEHPESKMRSFASYILRDSKYLNESHLQSLIKLRQNGDGWIPPAIARIGNKKAIEFLVEELKKEKQMHTQLTFAFEILGEKAVPDLIKMIDCKDNCDEELLMVVDFIFEELGEKASSAVPMLTEVALDNSKSLSSRKWAIKCLGSIGPAATKSAESLNQLYEQNPSLFEEEISISFQKMKHPFSVPFLIKKLKSNKEPNKKCLVLRDIAELGEGGKSAGPQILHYLNTENWDIRIAVARALGFIRYNKATPLLETASKNNQDWRLNYVAVISLGKFRDKRCLSSLAHISKNHWYPPVREKAAKAIELIDHKSSDDEEITNSPFGVIFFSYENVGKNIPRCDLEMGYQRELQLQKEMGKLVGIDRGEFGGKLEYINANGVKRVLMEDNIKGIFKSNGDYLIFTGIAHMLTNEGMIYKLEIDKKGNFKYEKLLSLPGSPSGIEELSNGEFLIDTLSGTVLLTKERTLQLADCSRFE